MSFSASGIEACRRLGVTALCVLCVVTYGCGSSDSNGQFASGGDKKLVKSEDYYRYVGKGRNKAKVSLSRKEKAQLRFEALKKLESQ